MPQVSVIIPCYNQGVYLAEAVDSVLDQTLQDIEIIVVNDGSTEPETRRTLECFSAPKTRIIHSVNQGLSAARNLGISHAQGKYILALDCDDTISPTYLAKAADLLNSDQALGIVYCKADYHGFQTGPWILAPFSFPEFIIHPCIFCSALYRRTDWQECGGYSVELKDGFEDHDFWLHLVKRGRKVHCIEDTLFHYRRMPYNMTHALTLDKQVAAFVTIFRHHKELFVENIDVLMRAIYAREARAQENSNFPTAQLFADKGQGYIEVDSIRLRYAAGDWVTINLPVPKWATTRRIPLRLDPGMQTGCYDVVEATLLKNGYTHASLHLDGNTPSSVISVAGTAILLPSSTGLRIFSYGSDPQIILDGLPLGEEADTLKIKLRFQASIDAAADSFGMLQKNSYSRAQQSRSNLKIMELPKNV